MKLIAFAGNNIGPFFDTTVSTFLHDGKYIIKAPIGSGKSFLFFDGPVFALYKNSSRPMLSIKATEGRVKILFEHDDKIIVCIRNITRTKFGNDTVKSLLYTIDNTSVETIKQALGKQDIITYQNDIFEVIRKIGTRTHIECKNETDIQATLEPFLPPQEVFLTTTILMQDSTNVFELTPGDRIALFKEIFGLLSIDSATDKISDERKAVTALLKSKQMTDDTDIQLRKYLQSWINIVSPLQWDNEILSNSIKDIEMIVEKITIMWFTRDSSMTDVLHTLQTTIADSRNEKQKLVGALQTWQKTYEDHLMKWKALEENNASLGRKIQNLKQESSQLQAQTTGAIEAQAWDIEKKYDEWQNGLPVEWFVWNGDKNAADENSVNQNTTSKDFPALRERIQEFMQQGAMIATQEKHANNTFEQLGQANTEDSKTILNYEEQLAALEWDYEQKKKFYCKLIWDDCPFIEQINESFFNTLQKSIDRLKDTITEQKKYSAEKNIEWKITEAKQQLTDLQKQLAVFKHHIRYTDYSRIKAEKQNYDAHMQAQKAYQQHQQKHQEAIQKNAEITGQLISLEQQHKDLQESLTTREQEKSILAERIDTKQHNEVLMDITASDKKLHAIQQALQSIERIEHLVQTHKDTQRVIKGLREREELLNDLYRIFSKEIMIKVLEDALPFFAEYVNNILAKMVTFSIHFIPKKTSSEKLELDITIRDEHGERSVKSLSWGQKAVLRLAWILGVAQMTHASQLFLDETINNIDQETIGLVADMLEDYIKLHDISLYLITHSSQLQHMQVWDRVIEIWKID